MFLAVSIWPGWGRAVELMKGSKDARVPARASVPIAVQT